MTSSLVGSEMCIRDRKKEERKEEGGKKDQQSWPNGNKRHHGGKGNGSGMAGDGKSQAATGGKESKGHMIGPFGE
eukprot:3927178-Prorocentrum_lima.AAC.1